jgi:hypothetical protein
VTPYTFSMSYNNSGVVDLGEKFVLGFENSLPNDDEGGVGSLNSTPCLIKSLVMLILFLVHRSCSPFVVT